MWVEGQDACILGFHILKHIMIFEDNNSMTMKYDWWLVIAKLTVLLTLNKLYLHGNTGPKQHMFNGREH